MLLTLGVTKKHGNLIQRRGHYHQQRPIEKPWDVSQVILVVLQVDLTQHSMEPYRVSALMSLPKRTSLGIVVLIWEGTWPEG